MKTLMVVCIALIAMACGNQGALQAEYSRGLEDGKAAARKEKCDSLCCTEEMEGWVKRMAILQDSIESYNNPKNKHETGQAHVHDDSEINVKWEKGKRNKLRSGLLELRKSLKEEHTTFEYVPYIYFPTRDSVKEHVSFDYAIVPIPDEHGKILRKVIVAVNLKYEKPSGGQHQHPKNGNK